MKKVSLSLATAAFLFGSYTVPAFAGEAELAAAIAELRAEVAQLKAEGARSSELTDRLNNLEKKVDSSSSSNVVGVGKGSKIQLYGYLRFRGEYNTQGGTINAAGVTDATKQRERGRLRMQARLGVKARVTDEWMGDIRIRTNAGAQNSGNYDWGLPSTGNNTTVGLDVGYIQYTPRDTAFKLQIGKSKFNFTKLTSAYWDSDLTPYGINATYSFGDFTLKGHYVMLTENSWRLTNAPVGTAPGGIDAQLAFMQGLYKTSLGGAKLSLSLGGMNISNGSKLYATGDKFSSPNYYYSSLKLGMGAATLGGEFMWSGAKAKNGLSSANTGFTVVGSYKLPMGVKLGLQYYRIEANSVPGDGVFTQDDFQNAGSYGVSNFEGIRVKASYKFNKHVKLEFNFYNQSELDAGYGALHSKGTVTDAFWNRGSSNRFQINQILTF